MDIDLDYFNLMDNPAQKLVKLLAWADCPVSFMVENHHEALRRWVSYIDSGRYLDVSVHTVYLGLKSPA
jgi:hypothetical protein